MTIAKEKSSFDMVMKNLNKEIKQIQGQTMKGLIRSAALIRRDMDKTSPKIPVDTGNLRQSWFTTPYPHKTKRALIMGFSANYALKVHEEVGTNFQRPGAGAKFFEASLNRNHKQILNIIKQEAKVR